MRLLFKQLAERKALETQSEKSRGPAEHAKWFGPSQLFRLQPICLAYRVQFKWRCATFDLVAISSCVGWWFRAKRHALRTCCLPFDFESKRPRQTRHFLANGRANEMRAFCRTNFNFDVVAHVVRFRWNLVQPGGRVWPGATSIGGECLGYQKRQFDLVAFELGRHRIEPS